ncbi:kinase-like protein [Metschnikowia bicuspidata var. bicuspidata NRRL YB-4993]|uniref:Kinase-like protein n=1 Tax=Metschnikowia bicuspidata var. bicuspidata NRRL YB-4993 TaxID=869754 RepID=A0A1A0HFT2_9ASCO|nr:kinase-like protein [Metschnikowia bicuspidata var. bicuspidata NRRL YB-4993]OBA22845.1 kinase-like protein [Metschnikowia bicuspidata var. bicuspidata NRRL YB-4993]
MSMITNRKRPRGFANSNHHESALLEEDECDDMYGEIDDIFEDDNNDITILEERKLKSSVSRGRRWRNNSDSFLLLEKDVWEAYNMFNVNNLDVAEHHLPPSTGMKKQRTNSLPQLPQVKCMYEKIPTNYILQHPKVGNVKTHVVPHKLNLPPCDDEDGHYVIKINDVFANRFVIQKLLGQGTFGKVVACYDKINRETVAIKIIRNIPKYRDAAKIELRVLTTLKKFDNENRNHCIHLRECLDFRGHISIVTDLLKISLYDFLENNKFIPYPGSHIQAISKQLIRSVTFFHDLNLIHTDLKPENILLHDDSYQRKLLGSSTTISSFLRLNTANEKRRTDRVPKFLRILNNPLIQIIDFGSAIFNDEYHSSVVCTRHYRAPEIVLGTGWSFPCDMWSVGCILVELVIGEPVFRTHDNLEHLAMIEKVVGESICENMVRLSKEKENECGIKYFTADSHTRKSHQIEDLENDDCYIDDDYMDDNLLKLRFPTPSTPDKFVKSVDQLSRIDLFVSERIGLKINFDYSLSTNYQNNQHLINFGNFTFWWFFIDLLKKLFVIDPDSRMTAREALEHPWFNLGIEDEGTT